MLEMLNFFMHFKHFKVLVAKSVFIISVSININISSNMNTCKS